MNLEQAVFRLVEAFDAVELRCFDEVAFGIIGPSMIAAAENEGRSGRFLCYSVCSMATYVVECADDTVFAEDDQDGEPGKLKRDVIAWFGEAGTVGNADPGLSGFVRMGLRDKAGHMCLAEDCSSFKCEQVVRGPPAIGKVWLFADLYW